MADETNLGCADTVIDARFSCDLCSLVGYYFVVVLQLILTLVAGVYRRNRAPLRKAKGACKATYFRQTSQLPLVTKELVLGREGGSGELLLQ